MVIKINGQHYNALQIGRFIINEKALTIIYQFLGGMERKETFSDLESLAARVQELEAL